MPTTRRRRIVRRAVMPLAILPLLLSGYVGSWLVFSMAAQANLVPLGIGSTVVPLFGPLVRYSESDWPGAVQLRALWWRLNRGDDGGAMVLNWGTQFGPQESE